MNRLIIIGNGFDLAHGLKTDYGSFIKWYLEKVFEEAVNQHSNNPYYYTDDLIEIRTSLPLDIKFSYFKSEIASGNKIVERLYNDEYFLKVVFGGNIINDQSTQKSENLIINGDTIANPFKVKIKSRLLGSLLPNGRTHNWIDIENIYYKLLIDSFEKKSTFLVGVEDLNKEFNFLKQQLEEYLQLILKPSRINEYEDIFSEAIINDKSISNTANESNAYLEKFKNVDSIHILNFNYTNTPELYLPKQDYYSNYVKFSVNYIHGKLNEVKNKIIFGFGDEHDDNYKKMEELNDNKYFEFVKSFSYFRTPNYEKLISFLEDREFQVFILGHSCGLSDRTMLKMIFEHEKCNSIKIFYHKTETDFIDKAQNISRHFTDKVKMRERIVNFQKSSPMPQANT